MRKPLQNILITVVWLLIWYIAALIINNTILLCTPFDVLETLVEHIFRPEFWRSILFTFSRIAAGFVIACAAGILLGVLGWRFRTFDAFFNPAILVMKSVPIVCFIVLLLIWFGSFYVTAIAVFLVVFPAIYSSVSEGLRNCDVKLAEMLRIFRVPALRTSLAFYWPSVLPFLVASCRIAVGMAWKSGVAAELIGIPLGSIGEQIYQSKILLSSADLFTWTLVVIIAALLCEKGFLYLLHRSGDWSWRAALPRFIGGVQGGIPRDGSQGTVLFETPEMGASNISVSPIHIRDLGKSFGTHQIIKGLSLSFEPGGNYALWGASGLGKSTFFALIAGLLPPDTGSIEGVGRISMVFQEARLIENRSALDNIRLTSGAYLSTEALRGLLTRILPHDSLDIPVSQLSGGMRRRVELCRALATPSHVLLLDEPFAGLDDESRQRAIELLIDHRCNRTLVITTHDSYDITALQALRIELSSEMMPEPQMDHDSQDRGILP